MKLKEKKGKAKGGGMQKRGGGRGERETLKKHDRKKLITSRFVLVYWKTDVFCWIILDSAKRTKKKEKRNLGLACDWLLSAVLPFWNLGKIIVEIKTESDVTATREEYLFRLEGGEKKRGVIWEKRRGHVKILIRSRRRWKKIMYRKPKNARIKMRKKVKRGRKWKREEKKYIKCGASDDGVNLNSRLRESEESKFIIEDGVKY